MIKWLRYIIALILLAVLLSYLATHGQQLKVLLKLRPTDMLMLYVLMGIMTINNARASQILLRLLNTKVPLWEMTVLQNAARLFNYLPMKLGTVLRANHLKRYYGLSYLSFATMFMYITVLMIATAAILGFIALATGYGFIGYENQVLGGIFAILLTGSSLALFLPLPVPTSSAKVATIIRNLLAGRKTVSLNIKVVALCMAHLTGTFILSSIRIAIIYHSIGQDINMQGYLILGSLGFCSSAISFTPGALGMRELVLGCVSVLLGIPLEIGILVAVFERAIMLSWTFVVGGLCASWLWHKCPTDFKKTNLVTEK